MAGIGFELRRAVRETSYLGTIRGYLYAAVVSSGPWLLSIATLSLLGFIAVAFLPPAARNLFAATATHSFAISLITTGVIQMVVTRYLADRLYVEDTASLAPTFVGVLVPTSLAQCLLMHLLLLRSPVPLDYRLPAVSLYVAVSGIWLAMIFLSAAHDYVAIVFSFLVGYAVSFALAAGVGSRFGTSAYVTGFAAGQVLTLALLTARLFAEFPPTRSINFAFFRYIRRYPTLLGIGITYNLAFWIDKIAFWFSREGINVNGVLPIFPPYDTAFFLASLTIVPALAIFLVNIETEFYGHYKAFYSAIANKHSWREIRQAKEGMGQALRTSYVTLLKVQGAVTLLTLALAPAILNALQIPEEYWYIFRIAVLAIGVQVFLLITVLILLYLDLRGSVLTISTIFLTANVGLTLLSIAGGYAFYGYGFLYASLISLIVAVILLGNRFRRLEYLTFTRQPLIPEEE